MFELHTPKYFSVLNNTDSNLFTQNTKHFSVNNTIYNTLKDSIHKELLTEHLNQHIERKAFDLRSIIELYYFDYYTGEKKLSIFNYLTGIQQNIDSISKVHLDVIIKKTFSLIREGLFLRYLISFLFPSKKYLETKFPSKKKWYPTLYAIYLLDFIKRIKL